MGQTDTREDYDTNYSDHTFDISLDCRAQLHVISQFASSHQGLFLPNKMVKPDRLKFICCRLHIFVQSIQEVRERKWCDKCEDKKSLSDKVYSVERLNGSKIEFTCPRGHKASMSIMDLRKFRSCEQCAIELQHLQIQNEQKQKVLFALAQSRMQEAKQQCLKVIARVKEVFGNTKLLSASLLQSLYTKIDFKGAEGEEELKVFCVFLILMHADICKEILRCFDQENRRRSFRLLCLLLHPDKNSHPSAKKAFVAMLDIFKGL